MMIISLIGFWIKKSAYDRPTLCKEFGISQNTLSNWCTGKTYPSVPQLWKLSSMLNVRVDNLYEFKGEE